MAVVTNSGRSQRQRSDTTAGQLIAVARELFGADGYTATLLDEVVRRAGVTKGALYHHFESKRDLFEAVFEREQREITRAAAEAYGRKRDHWEGLYAGCRAFFEASFDPAVQRITLLDAPSVLGWEKMREIEGRYTQKMLRDGLQRAMNEGTIARRPVEPLATMLAGAICEGAMLVARSQNQRAVARQILAELRLQLDALEEGAQRSR
jgi:AcrR family transcriptional regulator